MKKVFGILAHVDAGKTTLSEAILLETGSIRQLGRVDFRTTFLDNNAPERERGITVFSKQARFSYNGNEYTLIDTPGHSDFSPEVIRSLDILDFAILIISGPEGIQAHTKVLWELLKEKNIPVVFFVNKCDIDFDHDERILEIYETFSEDVPIFFGSALKNIGINELLKYIDTINVCNYPKEFSYKLHRVSRDNKNQRLNFIKITGGTLKVKDEINGEKVNEIRLYSGEKYKSVSEATPGDVVAVLGPTNLFRNETTEAPVSYRVFCKEIDSLLLFEKLSQISEELPQLNLNYNDETHECRINLMGKMDKEIFISEVKRRLDLDIIIDSGKIVFKETIASQVIGSGHFEPLRHYAEVHVKIEPLERGKGIIYNSICSADVLATNWQRLIIGSLEAKHHKGVLIGAPLTDVKITLIAGKSHPKHTEGGDFRQAACRAVRQGLMKAENLLLEPILGFNITLPYEIIGRAITDLTELGCNISINGTNVSGSGPLRKLFDYQERIIEYSHGQGKIDFYNVGYDICTDTDIVLNAMYEPQSDTHNSPDSVFCSHGSGEIIPWDQVEDLCDIDIKEKPQSEEPVFSHRISISDKELSAIFAREFKPHPSFYIEKKSESTKALGKKVQVVQNILIVDGYNLMYAAENMDRDTMLNLLASYSAYRAIKTYVVFDAYKVSESFGSNEKYSNLDIHYTSQAESADLYIEKLLHKIGKNDRVRVVTSDWMIQLSALSSGILRISSRELWEEIEIATKEIKRYIK